MTKAKLTEKQEQDLRELMDMPEEIRAKLLYIAMGLVMGAKVQEGKATDRSA